MGLDHLLLAFFWILFCVLHSLLASPSVKRRMKILMGKAFVYYRLLYVFFSFASMIAVFIFLSGMNDFEMFPLTNTLFITGVLVCFSGLILMVICIQKYFISLSGIRRLVQPGEIPRLMITGIHRYVRHPLYLGTFVFIWGLFLLIPYAGLLISDIIITIYTLIGIKLEESKLVEEFGEDYKIYRKKVPMLLPTFRHR